MNLTPGKFIFYFLLFVVIYALFNFALESIVLHAPIILIIFILGICVYEIITQGCFQNSDNYIFERRENEMYVKYKNKYILRFEVIGNIVRLREINLKRDINNRKLKFWEQKLIYNYIIYYYSKKVKNQNMVLSSYLEENSYSVREATEEEKNKYLFFQSVIKQSNNHFRNFTTFFWYLLMMLEGVFLGITFKNAKIFLYTPVYLIVFMRNYI